MPKRDSQREMLENAVYQQLFLGKKQIQGKNPEHTMQLTGIEPLLNKFIDDLNSRVEAILDKKIKAFIQYFEKKFKLDLKKTYKRIMENLTNMGGIENLEGQETVVIYIVLTKLVEALREHAYAIWGKQRIAEDFQENYEKKFGSKEEHQLQNLAATNNPNISLLYNLSFIMLLVNTYGNDKFQITVKRLTTLRVNRILKKLHSSMK